MPVSLVVRFKKLRVKSSAPKSNINENAICETTRRRRKVNRAGLEVEPRPEDFNAALGETLVPRRAGARLKRMQAPAATLDAKAIVRQSKRSGRTTGLDSVARNRNKSLLKIVATHTPSAAPAPASSTPSVSNWQTSRVREAPSAVLTVSSLSRSSDSPPPAGVAVNLNFRY